MARITPRRASGTMQLPTESSVGVERQLKRQCDTTYGRSLDSGIVDGEEHAIEDEQHDAAVHRDNKQARHCGG
jgi:hypothetical protein